MRADTHFHLAVFLKLSLAVREGSVMRTFRLCFEEWVRLKDVGLGAEELEGMEKHEQALFVQRS